MSLEEELQRIEDEMLPEHRKWGYIIYRTTYADEEQWNHCIEFFQELVRKITRKYTGGPEHASKYLDFPVRDDYEAFDNATTAQLRAHFKQWRRSNEALNEQGMHPNQRRLLWESMRYRGFVRINAEAMQSILEVASGRLTSSSAWVDVVQVDWPENDPDEESEDDEYDEDEENEVEDQNMPDINKLVGEWPSIEGVTAFNVGFQRVSVDDLYPSFWTEKDVISDVLYVRPPRRTYDM
ncbi:hypothetical protein BT63DRAFT_310446 [Microthyrium microscopicum]|uniref:Uncharacterized protein n=1 Tax=Microthyrium microscopicum TaxID=703497 RepID=A0A6A6U2I7_9PEZI|nr:hypothetical protein BT63DRAFT_310446 [Microthyrium microscopicum]